MYVNVFRATWPSDVTASTQDMITVCGAGDAHNSLLMLRLADHYLRPLLVAVEILSAIICIVVLCESSTETDDKEGQYG